MLGLVFRKMVDKKLSVFALLIGSAVLVGLVCADVCCAEIIMQYGARLWLLRLPVLLSTAILLIHTSNELILTQTSGDTNGRRILTYLPVYALIAAAAYAAGMVLGTYAAQLLVSGECTFSVQIDAPLMRSGAVGCAAALALMIAPVILRRNTMDKKEYSLRVLPAWGTLLLDVFVLLLGWGGRYLCTLQSAMIGEELLEVLPYVSGWLFMAGSGLIAVRIVPLMIAVVRRLFGCGRGASAYAAFLQVLRGGSRRNRIMILVTLSIAAGIFNLQAADAIRMNSEENIRYGIGADIVVREKWLSSEAYHAVDPMIPIEYEEPDFGRYLSVEGVRSAARVLHITDAEMEINGSAINGLQVMGIHTADFGRTAWHKDGMLPHHFYEYLNAMAVNSEAVLVSSNIREELGCALGDVIFYRNAQGISVRGVIYGFVDCWPGYYREEGEYLIVAHLAQLQHHWGILPYEVWINAEDSTDFIYNFARAEGMRFLSFENADAESAALRNNASFKALNRWISGGFAAVMLLCLLGYAAWWSESVRERSAQFAACRAMGMSAGGIMGMLFGEQLLAAGSSTALGIAIGVWTVKLYMPLMKFKGTAYGSMLPPSVAVNTDVIVLLSAAAGVVLLLCTLIWGGSAARMRNMRRHSLKKGGADR